MNTQLHSTNFTLTPKDNRRLASLCGQFDEHIKLLEQQLSIQINSRGHVFHIIGSKIPIDIASQILQSLYQETTQEKPITLARVEQTLQQATIHMEAGNQHPRSPKIQFKTKQGLIKARTPNQERYLANMQRFDLNFAIGPAGTGKTYLAVASAVAALEHDQVQRLILARPAVEAGERLGFLPGDLTQKVDPYLRPLYDALYDILGVDRVNKLIERQVIEIAPLAYMRGRTLNDAFIILDESQNTTIAQMKMFLTRLGYHSTAVVTGDITQVDLSPNIESGLRHVINILKVVDDIGFTFFEPKDVARHPLVQRIISAYDKRAD